MTDLISTPIDTDEGGDIAAGQLQHLPPQTLIIGDNVRTDAKIDADFLASIRQHGVLMPITAVRDDDGRIMVRDGQRRTLASQKAGLDTVPVYVLPSAAATFREWEVERIVQQIVCNDQKSDLTDAQRARGIQTMLDAGVSVAKVAKLISTKKAVVVAAETAGKSTEAMEALADGQLTLEQAAAVAEFSDDPETIAALIDAPANRFEHLLSQKRKQREADAAYAVVAAELQAQGVTVLEDQPNWRDLGCVGLRYLTTADGGEVTEDMVVPGPLWAALLCEDTVYVDATDGTTRVDEDDLDYDTRWHRDREAEDGLRHYDSVVEKTVVEPDWYCLDYAAAGFGLAVSLRNVAESVGGFASPAAAGSAGRQVIDAEAQAEADRRSRRQVIALNRLGDAAIPVRRSWIRTNLLGRKTLPKGAGVFLTKALLSDAHLITDYRVAEVAAELLGLSGAGDRQDGRGAIDKHLDRLGATGDGRAQVVALGLVLGGLEGRCGKDAWRAGGSTPWSHGISHAAYLTFLEGNGYTLSDIEQVIVGGKTADALFDELAGGHGTTSAPATAEDAADADDDAQDAEDEETDEEEDWDGE